MGDLHHRDLLVAADGSVTVVDLAMAWVAGNDAGALRRFVFERCRSSDRVALARLRARADGSDPDAAARAIDPRGARWHRFGRSLKSGIDRLRRRGER